MNRHKSRESSNLKAIIKLKKVIIPRSYYKVVELRT